MNHHSLTAPAHACSPDAHRAGTVAAGGMPEWLAHLIASVIRFMIERMLGVGPSRRGLPSWWHDRPDLQPGSAPQLAASIRGEFGTAIAWMCRRRGIGPGHPDWPELSRAIVAFGGSVKGCRPGLPACGLQWWENPNVVPGMIGEAVPTPAADAMASLLARQAVAHPPPPIGIRAATGHAVSPAPRPKVSARAATGPPIGPPADQIRHACMTGAGPRPAPPS